ncbi:3-hydroxyacyl-CoA dehydrogenase [Tistrella bauzanensis]
MPPAMPSSPSSASGQTGRPIGMAGVIGTGSMGRGIAQVLAEAGVVVRLADANPGAAEAARGFIADMLARKIAKGQCDEAHRVATLDRLVIVRAEPEAFAGVDLVVEAIVEALDVKRRLFSGLEPAVGPDCILASNTSSLSVTAIAAGCAVPERVAGFHFFNPVPVMKIVEVVAGARTAPWVTAALTALAGRTGHRAANVADSPGFLVNHAGRGFGVEALRILQDGVARPVDIDRIMRDAAGFRMGPFELFDLVGLDVSQPVMESIYNQFFQEPRFRPSPIGRNRMESGLLGRKTGAGFYVYENGRARIEPDPEPDPRAGAAVDAPIWVGPAADPRWRGEVQTLVAQAGLQVDAGARPQPSSIALLLPLGQDCTGAALAHDVDPRRAMALDPMFGVGRRLTLMTSPATDPALAEGMAVRLSTGDVAVTRIRDSVGFVAQRITAQIINVGCEIAQMRIAAPCDIDPAVEMGLGYPTGPLALGDRLGPLHVLTVLEGLFGATGDPRYRPSPWLSRRARLGLSLTHDEA